ncbi:HpcH/HpaI aldolase/citrate lyase family protein [Nitratireductor luteus]|uniref:HpcH/HpaI aldolase/citrate lyase family protein n=1 Tax=Nitratireductor luteus TaxID=2976980 RepID=UPI0022404935|nr:CoA ester lyase [Nitratireductor luteus]
MDIGRSLDFVAPLFVPGNRPERFKKAAASGADAIIIDLEDAVPAEAKVAARSALHADFTNLPVLVRIDGIGTEWHADDLAAVGHVPFAGIVVPKAQLAPGLEGICALAERRHVPVVALIETARGLADARAIAKLPAVERLIFGSIDFCADIACANTQDALLSARFELVLASRLAGKCAPVDGVTTAIDDATLVIDDSRHARSLGFGGKLCIHPKQVQHVLTGFSPDASEIAWARKVLASGDGATAVDGLMVDEPVRCRARSILRRCGQIGGAAGGTDPASAIATK